MPSDPPSATELRTLAVVLPLEPLRVGRTVVRTRWPRHVTVAGNLRTTASVDTAVAVVRSLAASLPEQRGVVVGRDLFGPRHDLPVDLVEGFDATHRLVLDALEERIPVDPVEPAHQREGFRGHVTTTAAGPLADGAAIEPASIALAEVGPGGDERVARVLAVLPLAPAAPARVDAATAARLCGALRMSGVRFWVVGGWGVDALLGRQTREHHDLDLLVAGDDLPRLDEVLGGLGLVPAFVWAENRAIHVDGAEHPTAFVALGPAGAEVDVHAVAVDEDAVPRMLTAGRARLAADALSGSGTIAGEPVPCFSVAAQRVAHTGYALPDAQVRDLALLDGLG